MRNIWAATAVVPLNTVPLMLVVSASNTWGCRSIQRCPLPRSVKSAAVKVWRINSRVPCVRRTTSPTATPALPLTFRPMRNAASRSLVTASPAVPVSPWGANAIDTGASGSATDAAARTQTWSRDWVKALLPAVSVLKTCTEYTLPALSSRSSGSARLQVPSEASSTRPATVTRSVLSPTRTILPAVSA